MKTKLSVNMLYLLSVLALHGVSIANGAPNISGKYEASKLRPTDQKKIEIYLQQVLLGQFGEGVGVNYDFSCNESDFSKIHCSYSFSTGGGTLGNGSLWYDTEKNRGFILDQIQD